MSKPTWTNDRVKLRDLLPFDDNPRMSSGKQAERITKSVDRFGQVHTVAIGPRGEVYDGHQRLAALKAKHGPDYEIDIRRASRELTDDERKRLVIALHSGAQGQYDFDLLANWDSALLIDEGMDADLLKVLDLERAAVAEMLKAEAGGDVVDAEPQIDKAALLAEKWQTKRGQVWLLGDHRLMCGDSTSAEDVGRLMAGEMADAVVTDPPYGMRLDTDYSDMPAPDGRMRAGKGVVGGKKWSEIHGDDKDFDPAPLFAIWSAKEMFLFGADYYSDRIPNRVAGSWLVWDKRLEESADKMFGSGFELCWSKQHHKRDIIRVKWAGVFGTEKEDTKSRVHPSHKPTELFRWIIERHTDTGATITDPYSGGGSCLISCEQLGRKCRAMEIAPEYVAVALQRFATATGKTPTLQEAAP